MCTLHLYNTKSLNNYNHNITPNRRKRETLRRGVRLTNRWRLAHCRNFLPWTRSLQSDCHALCSNIRTKPVQVHNMILVKIAPLRFEIFLSIWIHVFNRIVQFRHGYWLHVLVYARTPWTSEKVPHWKRMTEVSRDYIYWLIYLYNYSTQQVSSHLRLLFHFVYEVLIFECQQCRREHNGKKNQ